LRRPSRLGLRCRVLLALVFASLPCIGSREVGFRAAAFRTSFSCSAPPGRVLSSSVLSPRVLLPVDLAKRAPAPLIPHSIFASCLITTAAPRCSSLDGEPRRRLLVFFVSPVLHKRRRFSIDFSGPSPVLGFWESPHGTAVEAQPCPVFRAAGFRGVSCSAQPGLVPSRLGSRVFASCVRTL
jgi:hypothetical protein